MKILITLPEGEIRDTFFTQEYMDRVKSYGELIWNDKGRAFTKAELIESAKNADVIMTCWGTPKIDDDIVKGAKQLKVVAHLGGSVAPYVEQEVFDSGVKVVSGNDYFAESVAEGVIAYALSALRDIPYYSERLKNKRDWYKGYNRGIMDRSIGIVSFGAISKKLAKMLVPFRVNIKVYSRNISDEVLKEYNMSRASLEEIFSTCDIISIHTALNDKTHHMIDKNLLSMIKRDALFINTARGGVIDEKALIEELKTNRFKAVLDVFEVEPLPITSPLYDLENVIIMPHMGGPTIDKRQFITLGLLEDIKGYMENGTVLKHEISKEQARQMSTN
ncbi:MAG: hydroxyacid dehydrogenase [Oscillospiraceae bacterium]